MVSWLIYMDGSEFSPIFQQFPSIFSLFKGVYSIDTVPKSLRKFEFLIVNTSVSGSRGVHWFCLFKSERTVLECFDSLGFDQEKKTNLLEACNIRGIQNLKINLTQVQQSTSNTCGKYCIFFILERLHNNDLEFNDFLNIIFTDNCEINENKVNLFFNEMIEKKD